MCGACLDVCPVLIDIPSILVHLRAKQVDGARGGVPGVQDMTMAAAEWIMRSPRRFGWAEKAAGLGLKAGPLAARFSPWTSSRDLPEPPRQTFRQWWHRTRGTQ